jgi:hypothetical protein
LGASLVKKSNTFQTSSIFQDGEKTIYSFVDSLYKCRGDFYSGHQIWEPTQTVNSYLCASGYCFYGSVKWLFFQLKEIIEMLKGDKKEKPKDVEMQSADLTNTLLQITPNISQGQMVRKN